LHGLVLGPIELAVGVHDGVTQVSVTADGQAVELLRSRARQLSERLQVALDRPAQVHVDERPQTALRPTPPQGFEIYG
jgi:hypothetical protein